MASAPEALAQTTNWVTLSGGSPGVTAAGATNTLNWQWSPGGASIAGTVDITRTGAGSTYTFSESQAATITANGFTASAYNNSAYANSIGGVNGIFQFGSDGEGPRGANDVPAGAISVTTIDFKFNGTVSSPDHTILSLFDPGANESGISGPFTYDFNAYYHGVPIDTSSWTITVVDPYTPACTPSNYSWNATTATYTLSSFPSACGGNYPDTLVFIDTQNTTFDRLTLTATGLAQDSMALGIGSANLPNLPLTLGKTWVNGKSGDAVTLQFSGAGAELPVAGSSTAPSTTTVAYANGLPSQTVNIAETFTTGNASNYSITWECHKLSNSASVGSGTGAAGSFVMPTDSGVACAFSNSRIAQQLNLAKVWSGATAGHTATATTTGGTANATFSSTALTNTVGTAVTVYAGDTVTLPDESFGGGATAAMYITSLACSGGTPLAAGASNRTITISASTTATTCTYTNTKTPIIVLQKSLPNGRFNAADQFTLSIAGTGAPVPVTTTGSGATATGSVTVNPATIGSAYTLSETAAGGGSLGNYVTTYTCTNTLSGGQTPSGSGTSFSVTPVAGDNLTCTLANTRNPKVDLSIIKNNGTTSVVSGTTTTYTIVVNNGGPDAADGSMLKDPPVTGLSCATVTCSATGGAVCPSSPTVATLQGSGLIIPTFPASSSLTFTLSCSVQ